MNRSAFSLVELSIVLVILGLLVGGVLGGQSLIKAAQLRSVTTDFNKFQTAINAFQGKYNALPGDMSNAIDYWGAAHATPATCITTASTSQATCNGGGDGKIAHPSTGTYMYEGFRAWQHLANAGLAEGNFTGVAGPDSVSHSVPGTNIPKSKINGAGYGLWDLASYTDGNWFPMAYNHLIIFGGLTSNLPASPVLPTEDAFAIDSKIDDGKPLTGSVITHPPASSYSPGCASANAVTATYVLSSTGTICSLLFKLGF